MSWINRDLADDKSWGMVLTPVSTTFWLEAAVVAFVWVAQVFMLAGRYYLETLKFTSFVLHIPNFVALRGY